MSAQPKQQTRSFLASIDVVLDLRVQVAQRDRRIKQLETLNATLAAEIDRMRQEHERPAA